jgi:hypothetical protein
MNLTPCIFDDRLSILKTNTTFSKQTIALNSLC